VPPPFRHPWTAAFWADARLERSEIHPAARLVQFCRAKPLPPSTAMAAHRLAPPPGLPVVDPSVTRTENVVVAVSLPGSVAVTVILAVPV